MKPTVDEFEDFARKAKGNVSYIAQMFNVTRQAVHKWIRDDEAFAAVIKDSRMQFFDQCLDAGRILALGIPKFDKESGTVNGWIEKPDGQMLRYFISTLGKDEGFGQSQDINLSGTIPTVINIIQDSDSNEE